MTGQSFPSMHVALKCITEEFISTSLHVWSVQERRYYTRGGSCNRKQAFRSPSSNTLLCRHNIKQPKHASLPCLGSETQDKYDNFFFVVDLHAITVPQDPKNLKAGVINAAATYLAAGIDPEKSKVFVQVGYSFVKTGCAMQYIVARWACYTVLETHST